MKRFFGKALRWGAILLATLLVLLLAFYAEEDWRGARDWAACQRELAAKGETLDLRQLVPPGNPADDLSKVPIFAELDSSGASKARLKNLHEFWNSPDIPKPGNYFKGEAVDLVAWQKFFHSKPQWKMPPVHGTPAQDVLVALSQYDPILAEIDLALSNPDAFWPMNYQEPFKESIAGQAQMISISRLLQLRGVAYLENHQTAQALSDYLLSFRINRSLQRYCNVLNFLIMGGVRSVDNRILWEGFRRHAWSKDQLQQLESSLESEDMLALAQRGYRIERAEGIQTNFALQDHGKSNLQKDRVFDNSDPGIGLLLMTWNVRPSGWWNQDRCAYALGMQKLIEGIAPERGLLINGAFHNTEESFWTNLYTPLSQTALPVDRSLASNIVRLEAYQRLARLACRLEEYRIEHGQYPEKLDDLPDIPAHLNQEVLSEEPFHYKRKGDGYLLYSTGWDQKDDGGVIDKDPKQGDWVWPSP